MHDSNRVWWKQMSDLYPHCFNGDIRVVEFGSRIVNGTIRDYFSIGEGGSYVGVDWRKGRKVDLVSLVHEAPIESGSIDVAASASMLEHDPYWSESIAKMVDVLNPDGAIFLTWAAAGSNPHAIRSAPDKQYHPRPAHLIVDRVRELGMHVQSFGYETDGGRKEGFSTFHAWKNPDRLNDPSIEEYREEDAPT